MDRLPRIIAPFEVDGAYLPGGDESAELADSLTPPGFETPRDEDPEAVEDRLDASIFAAMLHP
jgi:hypothetical protein